MPGPAYLGGASPSSPVSVTIRDVARQAGVSISTVSRVLNDTCPVQPDKRRLVLDAAEALGYTPNPAARSLLGKTTGALGVLLPFVSGEFFSELLRGLDEAAQDRGLSLVISTSHRRLGEFKKAIQVMDRRVDGLIVMAPELDRQGTASVVETKLPAVLINTYAEGVAADVFNFDNHAGAQTLTQHLLKLGHRRIALVRGPDYAHDALERARGYRDAMAAAGLDGLEFDGGFTREDGYAVGERIAEAPQRPTAVVAANDYCAMGLMSALHAHGLTTPDDLSVVGFDGLASGQYTVPALTTARVPIAEIGYQAVDRLVGRLKADDEAPPEHRLVPVELVVRGSTAPPRNATHPA